MTLLRSSDSVTTRHKTGFASATAIDIAKRWGTQTAATALAKLVRASYHQ